MPCSRFFRHLALTALAAASASSWSQRATDPLAPVMRCIAAGKFGVLEQGRLPASATSRTVETAAGNKTVSLADGYRVILATSQGQPFVNLKVELSSAADAAADRATVEAQMALFASRRSGDQQALQRAVDGEVELLSLHQSDLERGGPISFYSLFVPSKALIASLYVLNQPPGQRAFSTYADYEVLRDEAVKLVQGCAAAGGA